MPEAMSQATRISYVDQGQDEPALLFLPGWCGSRRVFDQLAETCASARRSLSLDWRGHGQSETPLGDFGSSDLVEDALSVIEASEAARVVPVALSHAGWVAIELRRRLGSRISHLVFLDWIVMEAPLPFLEVLQFL
jgi:pimeloyl-ACP methyl ester carboxylesterase